MVGEYVDEFRLTLPEPAVLGEGDLLDEPVVAVQRVGAGEHDHDVHPQVVQDQVHREVVADRLELQPGVLAELGQLLGEGKHCQLAKDEQSQDHGELEIPLVAGSGVADVVQNRVPSDLSGLVL